MSKAGRSTHQLSYIKLATDPAQSFQQAEAT